MDCDGEKGLSTATQEAMILQALENGAELTPLDALRTFGCLRLGARIYNLRRKGYEISARLVETANGKRVSAYRLVRRMGR